MKNMKVSTGMAVLCTALILCGCGSKLPDEYAASERLVPICQEAAAREAKTDLFAKDLCVVMMPDEMPDSSVTAEAAGVFNITDTDVVYDKHVFEQLYPASITKVMTALVAIKYGNLNDTVTVTRDAVITESGASLCHINPGDVLTMEQLLYGLMLPSGNDAAAAIAVHMSGSIEAFSELMNQEAKALGATGTHFVNPHGLTDEQHYTTAYDLYLILNEALKYPKFREVTGSTMYNASYRDAGNQPISQVWKGGNWYMTGERDTPNGLTVFSSKTGTTNAAGYCLIMASRDAENKEYISVILKAGSRPLLYDNMTNIIQKIVN